MNLQRKLKKKIITLVLFGHKSWRRFNTQLVLELDRSLPFDVAVNLLQPSGRDARLGGAAVEANRVREQSVHVLVEVLGRFVHARRHVLLDDRQVDRVRDALVIVRLLPFRGNRY